MSDLNSKISSRIDVFVRELSSLVRNAALESVSQALSPGGRPTPDRATASVAAKAPARAAKPAKRSGKPAVKAAAKPAAKADAKPAAKPAVKAAPKPAPAAKGKGGRRDPSDIVRTMQRVFGRIGAKPGERLEQIAAALELKSDDLKLPIIKLLAAKRITKKGQRRGTTYYTVRSN